MYHPLANPYLVQTISTNEGVEREQRHQAERILAVTRQRRQPRQLIVQGARRIGAGLIAALQPAPQISYDPAPAIAHSLPASLRAVSRNG